MLALVVTAVPFAITMPAAFAGLGFGVTPTFPTTVTIGQVNVPASLQILNASTPPENTGNVTLNFIRLVPACGTFAVDPVTGDCPLAQADPGVLALSPSAVGEAGTACAGLTFTVVVIDPATGQVQFNPTAPIVLTPPGTPNSVCRLDFTFNVLKAPVHPAAIISPTTYETDVNATANGTSAVNNVTKTNNGGTVLDINKATLSSFTTTTASPTGKVGAPITDTASPGRPVPAWPAADRDRHLHALQHSYLHWGAGVHFGGAGERRRELHLGAVHADGARDLQMDRGIRRRRQ